jgi:hypothetical protein
MAEVITSAGLHFRQLRRQVRRRRLPSPFRCRRAFFWPRIASFRRASATPLRCHFLRHEAAIFAAAASLSDGLPSLLFSLRFAASQADAELIAFRHCCFQPVISPLLITISRHWLAYYMSPEAAITDCQLQDNIAGGFSVYWLTGCRLTARCFRASFFPPCC